MWTIFKVFIESVTRLLLFYVLVFWPLGMWDLNPLPEMESSPPALEGKVLTTGPPEVPPIHFLKNNKKLHTHKLAHVIVLFTRLWVFGGQKLHLIRPYIP